ncbi:MAG: PKD domain-containing protein [Candidatus Paceibacterota bacterium]
MKTISAASCPGACGSDDERTIPIGSSPTNLCGTGSALVPGSFTTYDDNTCRSHVWTWMCYNVAAQNVYGANCYEPASCNARGVDDQGGTGCSTGGSTDDGGYDAYCGTADGHDRTGAPVTISELCEQGNASQVSFNGSAWTWTCYGKGGGASKSCASRLLITGVCGGAKDIRTSIKPTSNLCTIGTASAMSNTEPWTWTCAGSRNSANATCAAPLNHKPIVNAGIDKTAVSNQSIVFSDSSATDADQDTLTYSWTCTGGTLSSANILKPTYTAPVITTPVSYNCFLTVNDQHGGVIVDYLTIAVSPVNNGACGSAATVRTSIKPTTNLCGTGSTASAVSNIEPWTWTCKGSGVGATTATCTAPLNHKPTVSAGPDKTVESGKATSFSASAADIDNDNLTYQWTCTGGSLFPVLSNIIYLAPTVSSNTNYTCIVTVDDQHGGIITDSVIVKVSPVAPPSQEPKTPPAGPPASRIDGACGSAATVRTSIKPIANLCVFGNTVSAVSNTEPWTWTCYGTGAGATNITCTAPLNHLPTVSAGPDKTVESGKATFLTASATDADNDTPAYQWSCTGGSIFPILSSIIYVAPTVSSNTNYVCIVSANDQHGGVATDSANVVVTVSAAKTGGEIDGACGSSAGQYFSFSPDDNLCSDGSSPVVSFTNPSGPWTWVCSGSNGGDNKACTAPFRPLPGWQETSP